MKRLAFILCTALTSVANAQPPCLASGDFIRGQQLLFVGPETWLANVGNRLFVINRDQIAGALQHSEHSVWLVCGSKDRPIAYSSKGKVFSYENGSLHPLVAKAPGNLEFADGKVLYSSVELGQGGSDFVIYASSDGKTREIAKGRYTASAADNHFYLEDKEGFSIFQDGQVISRVPYPQGASGVNLIWRSALLACRKGQDGIYPGKAYEHYVVRSRFGERTLRIPGAVPQVETNRQCSEYVLIQRNPTGSTLWSLTPGKKLGFAQIPTPCSVDAFALNEDGSIHYRCGTQFHYLDATRTTDTAVGEIPPLFDSAPRDRWLVTPAYGTLYANTTEPGPGKASPQICFARLVRDTMTGIGCTPIAP